MLTCPHCKTQAFIIIDYTGLFYAKCNTDDCKLNKCNMDKRAMFMHSMISGSKKSLIDSLTPKESK